MVKVCAWCLTVTDPGTGRKEVSHGLCEDCFEAKFPEEWQIMQTIKNDPHAVAKPVKTA